MIVCAGQNEQIKGAVPIGIGLVDSAINLTKICLENELKEIIFVGSAGSYGKVKIFETVEVAKVSNIEISFLQNLSYTPIENIISLKDVSCETNLTVNSSNYITSDEKIAKIYLQKGIDIENMEFFAVANVAKKFGIKCKGIFVITNYCDKLAHDTFIKNHQKAKKIMEKIVEQYR